MPRIASARASSRFRRTLAGAVILALASRGGSVASAQSFIVPNGLSAPAYGGTPDAPRFSQAARLAAATNILLRQPHLNPLGKPCVAINPISNAQAANGNIYDHSLLINNGCGRPIRLSVCYYQTRNCSTVSIAGYARQRKLFGVFPDKDFRIEYREYLD
jgi:hypothetical protein